MMKGLIQVDITLVNIYIPNIGAPTYMKQLLTDIKGDIDSKILIIGDFNTPLTPMNRSSRQKINKKTVALHDTQDQINLIDIFKHFTPKQQNIFSSQVHIEHFPV